MLKVVGSEFQLEEGADYPPDSDGERERGFLFIAYCDGFDIQLSVHIHGSRLTRYDFDIQENDLEYFEIKEIQISNDSLDLERLFQNGNAEYQ